MKIVKNRTAAILIAIFLTLLIGASTILIVDVNGQTLAPGKIDIVTYAFINVGPSPIGIGQTAYINMWIDKAVPDASGLYGDRWMNFTIQVTKPDGTTTTLGPFISDDTGGTYTTYIPEELGNYTFVFNFPGQILAGNNLSPGQTNASFPTIGDYFEPSISDPETLMVQQQPIAIYPSNPLPTTYWETPVNNMNTGWYSITGNWLGTGMELRLNSEYNASENFNPYSTGPSTAHIMWTAPFAEGGLIGGAYGSPQGSEEYTNFYSASQYEPKFAPPVILNGVLYYNLVPGSSNQVEGWVAVDLFTGKTLWVQNITTSVLRLGQILDYVSVNQYGGLAYLWGSSGVGTGGSVWSMYDAMTGNFILSIYGVPGSIDMVPDSSGDLVGYSINATAGTQLVQGVNVTTPVGGSMLVCWNASEAIDYPTGYIPGVTALNAMWRPTQGANISYTSGIMWKEPIATQFTEPSGTNVTISPSLGFPSYTIVTGDALLLISAPDVYGSGQLGWGEGWQIEAGYSLDTGAQLWIVNRTEAANARLSAATACNNGVYTEFTYETQTISAFDINTGAQLWGPVSEYVAGDVWGSYSASSVMAYGLIFTDDLGGYVYALNATTGATAWIWNTGNGTYETPYNVFPTWFINCVAGGFVYVMGGHEYSPPLFHGAQLYCLNATTGQEVWNILDFPNSNNPSTAIADGILVVPNAYDNLIYALGQGPSKTTISAPDIGVTTTTPITITGTVMDISAGSQQEAVAANFPNGLPCVSDSSMSQFMEAVYEQQPMPTNITGVPVTISVLDSNGNNRIIGTTTTDAQGTFGYNWTPDITGNYTVTATFAGTDAYYGSSADTYLYANAPPSTPIAPTASPTSAADKYFVPAIAGLFVLIIIVLALVAIMMLRKRP